MKNPMRNTNKFEEEKDEAISQPVGKQSRVILSSKRIKKEAVYQKTKSVLDIKETQQLEDYSFFFCAHCGNKAFKNA
jgi:hypothetical protein